MDSDYDRKFQEMKKYIPFLENMITRLESTSTLSSNPRQAQLDKIRSLRDLLSNKKKRMKMENLLKCEQVLVNLYAKVEQRDTLSLGQKSADSVFAIDSPTLKEKSDLEAVRNKLKSVAKLQECAQDTLPEILPRSEVNDVRTTGTKEPALFQRRPNQQLNQTTTITDESKTSPPGSASKRSYTRVLVSPESRSRHWSPSQASVEKPLFIRRSPRKSPRRYSPSYYKKERKKTKESQKRKDLNITLNVPEESLNSLNTKDILSRIINCSDGDVDIDTLRELRKQILGELKKTGAKDDISDLILKSYKKKEKTKKVNKFKKQVEIEEGELSDSESEAIESIYGSLVVKDPGQLKASSDKDQPRKIQICLVINSDDNPEAKTNEQPKQDVTADFAELVMYEKGNKEENSNNDTEVNKAEPIASDLKSTAKEEKCNNVDLQNSATTAPKEILSISTAEITDLNTLNLDGTTSSAGTTSESIQFKANFYKPLKERSTLEIAESVKKGISCAQTSESQITSTPKVLSEIEHTLEQMENTQVKPLLDESHIDKNAHATSLLHDHTIEKSAKEGSLLQERTIEKNAPEIPLLHERTIEKKPPESTLSEIDILQALKNEILSDISMPGTDSVTTPLLHQPKVMKVASAQEILPKKRISIEKYKQKSVVSSKSNLDLASLKEDNSKKTSLKLTDKECERFFNIPKISFDDEDESFDEDENEDILARDVYDDLAPKSPDHDENSNIESAPPVIIPEDPIKKMPVTENADVDMRTLPLTSPNSIKGSAFNNITTSKNSDLYLDKMKRDKIEQTNMQNRTTIADPRVRNLNQNISNLSPNPHVGNIDRTSRPNAFVGISSTGASNSIITPTARTYEMTPTHQSFEMDPSSRKHVYVPTINNFDIREKPGTKEVGERRPPLLETSLQSFGRSECPPTPNHPFGRSECPSTPSHPFGRLECPPTPNHPFGRSDCPQASNFSFGRSEYQSTQNRPFSRAECPPTPSHPFGRSECPSTPSHPFGRSECPPTPSHPFGRSECPLTPSHPFGRAECPPTPSHPFGRSECPPTPSHPFGRSECPPTPSHPFGRSECPPTPSHPFGRSECPPTPSHPFGRSECPPTPSHPFGRSECPPTPSHPFGRSECPPTPSHPFGRLECPSTPSHPFGRSESPPTPNHHFGRSDCPSTPSHPFGRSEGPSPLMLNKIDCSSNKPFSGIGGPTTPSTLFVRNECASNNSHMFAQSDCAPNKNHSYGYSEASQTKSPFNRSDPTTFHYGRSDFSSQKYVKDPRLNRELESESKSKYDERELGCSKDRDSYRASSFLLQKPYGGLDNFHYHESRSGRYNKYKYYAPELRPHKDQDRYARSCSRSMSKDYESDGSRSKDRRYNKDAISHEEYDCRMKRERSLGQSITIEEKRSSSRASSVGRHYSRESDDNTLSVKSNAGRSFTIDTSVNTTFQKYIDQAKNSIELASTFDARRQRAASVGRSLRRDSSAETKQSKVKKTNINTYENITENFRRAASVGREAFRRASSVGRDAFDSKTNNMSFQEVKADFKSFKFAKQFNDKSIDSRSSYKSKEAIEYSGRNKKDSHEKQRSEYRGQESSKSSYSPRMNYRDPRMRKMNYKDPTTRKLFKEMNNKSDRDRRDARKSGIVYSNDNIVTGSILASGYGVKNYKIPKIKRVPERKEVVPESIEIDKEAKDKQKNETIEDRELNNEKKHVKNEQNSKEKSKIVKTEKSKILEEETSKILDKEKSEELCASSKRELKKESDDIGKLDESIERRSTRSSRKNLLESKVEMQIAGKTKKDKHIGYDSDNDLGTQNNVKEKKNEFANTKSGKITKESKLNDLKETKNISPKKLKSNSKKLDPADLDSSFGMDDLEMFSDNIVSDRVIDNINALIADLDNDLSTSKSDSTHNFTNEISLENMLQNISSPAKDNLPEIQKDSAKVFDTIDKISNNEKDISVVVENKDHQIQSKPSKMVRLDEIADGPSNMKVKNTNVNEDPLRNAPTQSDQSDTGQKEANEKCNSSPLACLTKLRDDIDSTTEVKDLKETDDKSMVDQRNDGCSTPDSTINTEETMLTSSKEESLPGGTNEVTSTETIEPKPSSSFKETGPGLDSLGNLLSILQDKSKIKELLNMLGSQSSDNEKIKKKLEKLSEIVSDDEDTCDVPTTKTDKNSIVHDKQIIDDKNIKKIEDDHLNKDSSSALKENDSKLGDDDAKPSDNEADTQETDTEKLIDELEPKKKPVKKAKHIKKSKFKPKKVTSIAEKRVTRATAAETKPKIKKLPRELMQLQEDIREMFIRDDVLSATGIRMCRLAKLVDEKVPTTKEEPILSEAGPVVVLEKFKEVTQEIVRKKKLLPKTKVKTVNDDVHETVRNKTPAPFKNKPGPKSKTKNKKDSDPYAFELDSVSGINTEKVSEDSSSSSSDSESDSLASLKSFESNELLSDIKKKTKRKRRGWQVGVIKQKAKKKKSVPKQTELVPANLEEFLSEKSPLSDFNCFTDRNYCFQKNLLIYPCRLCRFSGNDIVLHYRNQHPHVEIPLSRMAPDIAKEAIEQCEEINFKAISKIPSDKYVCTFCFKEFTYSKSVLETFFWHIVSMHTGEYKQDCSKCVKCPMNLDIPSPPKDAKGQLIGFICKKCNFTQISLENLKTHVIVRHNDEQTAVYTINLSAMTKKALGNLLRRGVAEQATSLPVAQVSEQPRNSVDMIDMENEGVKTRTTVKKINPPTPIQSKITFEGDDNISDASDLLKETEEASIKLEKVDSENSDISNNDDGLKPDEAVIEQAPENVEDQLPVQEDAVLHSTTQPSNDIFDYPHFKISQTASGAKEYYCCINGNYHFKTTLLISMKKHVQIKHSENWEGYCYVCKVIVTPQGAHRFRDCLQHYLDIHMDNFPVFEKEIIEPATPPLPMNTESSQQNPVVSKPYINVRPLSELITRSEDAGPSESDSFPVIQSVVSLGPPAVEAPRLSPDLTTVVPEEQVKEKEYKYEEHQAQVITNKYYLVSQAMITPDTLIKVFKCSGRYCLYATDSTEEALAHATTHQRVGGADALNCSYCNFDSAGNAIDLVMHVFKCHASCQYCCQQCFYRAASSQAVAAHMTRAHGVTPEAGSVLRTTTTASIQIVAQKMLTREEAVPYYVCGHTDRDGPCKFRTFTPNKFCEHLVQRHSTATSHPCNLCSVEVATGTDLAQHLKEHGFKLYQCTWCVHGADNEKELLLHVSAVHPDKQPQAYIRISTNKESSTEVRVLPLAFLNKLKMPTKDMTPTATKEHPVREAERSIEMETLLKTYLPAPNEILAEPTEIPIQSSEIPDEIIDTPQEILAAPQDTKPQINIELPVPVAQVPDIVQPTAIATSIASPPLVAVKTEPEDKEKNTVNEVVLLDSEDEDTPSEQPSEQPVVEIPEDGPSPEKQAVNNVPVTHLFTCPKCKQVCKNKGGLKKHIYSCVINIMLPTTCPHCQATFENIDKLFCHYALDHRGEDKYSYECGLCGEFLSSQNIARKHLKSVHNENSAVFSSTRGKSGRYSMNPKKKPEPKTNQKVAPKRKLSGPKGDATPAKRRFDPQEIDLLPINPIFDHLVYCNRCEFSTKVRPNMVRHLQLHSERQPAPQTAPVNPVPHLETHEKHFDKMVNLAASSAPGRAPERVAGPLLAPEAMGRYPVYVPERMRYTCGARDCAYTSLDETMLHCHWDTLHADSAYFRCTHCPSHQSLDTTKPITAGRVLAHMKMHDSTLFACSACAYYHYRREAVEKHRATDHPGARLLLVRDEAVPAPPAPTMDLKPWQCGLCSFRSMLRPDVADHCAKLHHSKMQFRCAYCPFRTSALENITKHQMNSHAGKPEEVFYYYYREGSVPDEDDGTPRWMKQRQKTLASGQEPDVKVEPSATMTPKAVTSPAVPQLSVDLDLVKKEAAEVPPASVALTLEELCKKFGKFCDPNGIKYKCPLCAVITEDTNEAMQSHLYEELNYRKWSCGQCTYKAFHKAGLSDHMMSEHRRRQYEHVELPTDVNIEKWVTAVLSHQTAIINKHKENLAKLKMIVESTKPGPSTALVVPKEPTVRYSDKDLETAFGYFGAPLDRMFCCPKCTFFNKDEVSMKDHLEMELNKIRWCCTNCPDNFQTYHEAQFHCKGHDGPSRPIEAVRDPIMRGVWISTAIQRQKDLIQSSVPTTSSSEPPTPEKTQESDNSLLVVRYEERVPTPEQHMGRKRPFPDGEVENRDTDEPNAKRKADRQCSYCNYKNPYIHKVKLHMLSHFNLKPYSCSYCQFTGHTKKTIVKHIQDIHVNQPILVKLTELPANARKVGDLDSSKLNCLVCEKAVSEADMNTHLHNNVLPEFTKTELVLKCSFCLVLCLDLDSMQAHHAANHNKDPIKYELYKIGTDSRETYKCPYCGIVFKHERDYKSHHFAVHEHLTFPIMAGSDKPKSIDSATIAYRNCARKSTTKLPSSFARKSTTKLPDSVSLEEYSYYGTKPAPLEQYGNVTTLMSFCNMLMPFTMKQLSEHINIEPQVVVSDIKNSSN